VKPGIRKEKKIEVEILSNKMTSIRCNAGVVTNRHGVYDDFLSLVAVSSNQDPKLS
jgi:hypothetical protein